MTLRSVLRMGDERLYQIAERVSHFDTPQLYQWITDMYDTMHACEGAGISAPQIAINKRIVIFGVYTPRYPDAGDVPETVLINPEIIPIGDAVEDYWEACLSVPGLRGLVSRPRHIYYRGHDPKGTLIEREAIGFHARVVQHEVDHLNGLLFPQRFRNLEYFGYEEEVGFNQLIKKVTNES